MEQIKIGYVNDEVVVSSKEIAENFKKRHDNVIKDIEKYKKDVLNFEEMFFQTTMPDKYGREQKAYLVNRDGFTLLVMGFTGKEALEWKLKYITAFNENERKIKGLEYPQRSTSIGEVAKLSKEVRITGEKAGVNSVTIASSLCKLWRMNGLVLNEFEHEVNELKEQKKSIQTQMRFELTLIDD